MTTTPGYRLKIEGPGINVNREVPREVAQRAVLLAFGDEGQSSSKLGAGTDGARREDRGDTGQPDAFLRKHEANKIPDKIVALGAYMQERQGKDTFSRDDLLKAFEDAHEPTPKNLPRDMKTTLRRNWIAEKRGTRGHYYTTQKGKQALTANFKGIRRRSSKPKKGKTQK